MANEFDSYARELRQGLRGLPRPDIDDIAEEIRSDLRERIGQGDKPEEAAAALGLADRVAAEIVLRRITSDTGGTLPEASRGQRVAAWCADALVGGALLWLNPAWFFVLGAIQERYWMTEVQRAQLAAMPEYVSMTSGLGWAVVTLMAGFAWAVFYWLYLRRARSISLGMRMAGLSRIATPDGVWVVRTSDIAESEPARIVARPKWYLAAPVVALTPMALIMVMELVFMTVGSFMQPFNPMLPVSSAQAQGEESRDVVSAFYDAVIGGDVDAARVCVAEGAAFDVSAFIADRAEDGIESWAFGPGVPPSEWYVVETLDSGKQRTVGISVIRVEETSGPGDITVHYRIIDCTDDPLNRGVVDPE
jgi:hypothetical protein